MTIILTSICDRPRRGFAMVAAIALLAFTGAALLAIATLVSRDARRTATARQDAQLRQLLLAGAAAVQDRAATWPASLNRQEFDLPVPSVGDEQPRVQVTIAAADQAATQAATVEITAQYAGRRAHQQLQLQRIEGTWKITAATLNPTDESR